MGCGLTRVGIEYTELNQLCENLVEDSRWIQDNSECA